MNEVINTLSWVREHKGPGKWSSKYLGAAYDHLRMWHPSNMTIIQKIVESWSEYIALGKDENDKDYDMVSKALEGFKARLNS